MKRAIITGVTGQDGSHLADLLLVWRLARIHGPPVGVAAVVGEAVGVPVDGEASGEGVGDGVDVASGVAVA